MKNPSKRDWAIWLDHPITIAFFDILQEERGKMVESLVLGGTLSNDTGSTQRMTAEQCGRIFGIDVAMNAHRNHFSEEQ